MSLLFLFALVFAFVQADDVVVVTADNFDDFVKTNDYVLVEFYAPWVCNLTNRKTDVDN